MSVDALITDDYLEVEAKVAELHPELVLGTQMERHISKRLGLPCAVISAPVHVQDFPARYSPQMGFEGANVIFDSWVHPLMMGLEEHLLDDVPRRSSNSKPTPPLRISASPRRRSQRNPSRSCWRKNSRSMRKTRSTPPSSASTDIFAWTPDAEKELKKIPFFVRGKARRNTERFAVERGVANITIETLYDAKAHFSR